MITRYYKVLRWLSLDITAGAILVSMLFCKAFSVAFAWQEMTLLGLSVWIIYNVDHILDVRTKLLNSERREFHRTYQRILVVLIAIASIIAAVLLFSVSKNLLIWGTAVTLLSICYFLVSHRIAGIKEFSGAMIYTVGVTLIPLIQLPLLSIWLPMVLLFLLASLNLVLFSFLDRHVDKQEAMPSFTGRFGTQNTRNIIFILAILLGLVNAWFFYSGGGSLLVIFFGLGLIVHLVIFLYGWFHDFDRFKMVGDLTFVSAGLLLFL